MRARAYSVLNKEIILIFLLSSVLVSDKCEEKHEICFHCSMFFFLINVIFENKFVGMHSLILFTC